ncbi:MAG: GNAT family N-acetyltransferase [Caldilineaceae bacterium]|nr:GNAT family N-acetyltransferase [Caldilineaceae bacterium]
MKVIVRTMREQDVAEMVNVFDQVASDHPGYISFSELQEGVALDEHTLGPHRREIWQAEFTDLWMTYPQGQFVAEDLERSQVVGFQVMEKAERRYSRYGILQDFCLLPAYRGGGIGQQLFQAALDQLQRDGITRVFFESGYENHSFHEWAARWGFKPISVYFMADQPQRR